MKRINSIAAALIIALTGSTVVHAATIVWTNGLADNVFTTGGNWIGNTAPGSGDLAQIDLSGANKAVFSAAQGTYEIQRAYVGTVSGRTGELDITGGNFRATVSSNQGTRIGAGGGTGTVNQSGGTAEFGHIVDLGRSGSTGTYNLSGGLLDIFRSTAINTVQTSLQLGDSGGNGTMNITGGELKTRAGVQLLGANAKFSVSGSDATAINIGEQGEGYWSQAVGAILEAQIDVGGLTAISVNKGTNGLGGNVVFASGALLDVAFLDGTQGGYWDVMTWEGTLTNNGLTFAPGVDTDVWSFSFVDTDVSGTPDTLRITAIPEPATLSMLLIGAVSVLMFRRNRR